MLPRLRSKTLMKDLSQSPTSSSTKKPDRKPKKLFKSKTDKASTLDFTEEKLLPTLIIEPSSDGEEFPTGSLDPITIFQSKSRSLSYTSHESVDEGSITMSDVFNDVDHTKYMKNYFRRRGKSMEIPKPCVHCILLEKFNSDIVSQSSDREYEDNTNDDRVKIREIEANRSKPYEIVNAPKPGSFSTEPNDNLSRFLKVPEQKDVVDINCKPRSQSIDQIIDYLSIDRHNLSIEFIMINNNKPRAVSIDFNIPFQSKYGILIYNNKTVLINVQRISEVLFYVI